MNKFIVRLKHDNGIITVIIYTDTEQTAKKLIMKYENCPENAIEVIATQNKI